MISPKLNTLRMFDAAARHLNFRLASEELNLTQGAVAQQVRQLEKNLGIKLFHRVARGVVLTDIGNNYHKSIQHALAIIDEATSKLRSENANVTLSVTPSLASKWLVPRLPSFANSYPEIEVNTIASEDIARFHSDGVDIAIRQGQLPISDTLKVEFLAPLALCAVCSPDYAEQVEVTRGVVGFSTYRLIQDAHRQWEKLFEEEKISVPSRTLLFNQTALAMDAAANGQGIALAPKILLETEIASGKLVLVWEDQRENQGGFYVVYPNKQKPNYSAWAIVIEWLLSKTRKLR